MNKNSQKYTKPFTIQTLAFLNSKNKIWLNPEYQRESVWTISQKQLLIDSILRGIDIPKIYFRKIEKNKYEYEVVDGQQRLRSIFDFLKDNYRLSLDSDKVDELEISGKNFSKLKTELQIKLQSETIDIVILENYNDDDIEETFLRLQNGTPLNAAEKRRAIPGCMKNIVELLSSNKVFKLCAFSNKRFAYEDAVAKILHITLNGDITDIRPVSINDTYKRHLKINEKNKTVVSVKNTFNFLVSSFKDSQSPQLKKFSIITLVYITIYLLENYNLNQYKKEFADAYLEFEKNRIKNNELDESDQDPEIQAYTDAARSDGIANMKYRHDFLLKKLVSAMPELLLKDNQRGFTAEQRFAIFAQNKGCCQDCNTQCTDDNFHADHIIPHSKAGQTKISNGQVLCSKCNLSKGNRN
jgi:hypothetical protein